MKCYRYEPERSLTLLRRDIADEFFGYPGTSLTGLQAAHAVEGNLFYARADQVHTGVGEALA